MKNNLSTFIRNLSLVFILPFLINIVMAQQPCNDDVIMNTKGVWKKTSDANMKAGNQAQVISRIDKMQKILQAAYPEPRGVEAKWYRSMINNPLVANGPITYQLNSLFLGYFCNGNNNNIIEASEETGTWFYVWANHFNGFAQYVDYFTVKQQPVYLLTPKAGELNGYPLYNGIHNENTNTGVKHSRAIIIARDGQSPYMPVTKKQYLKGFLLFNEKKLSVELASIEKNTSVKTDEEKQRKEKWMADTKNRYKTEINRVKELLAKSAEEELQQPVIVDGVDFSRFKGFSTAAEGGRQLVRLNSEYFDGRLPEYVPQFLIVYWRWDKKKSAENFKNQLEANFNFTELKEMIDK